MNKGLIWRLKSLYNNLEQGDDFMFDSSKKLGRCILIHSKILESLGAVYLEKDGDFYTVNVDDKQKFMVLFKSNIELLYK